MVINRHTDPCLIGQVHYALVLIDDLTKLSLESPWESYKRTYVLTFAMDVFAVS